MAINQNKIIYIFFKIVGYLLLYLVLTIKTIKSLLKKLTMKNSFKVGVLALAIAFSFAACKSKSGASSADSAKMADSAKAADSAKMADSSKMKVDSSKMDTTKKDTTKK